MPSKNLPIVVLGGSGYVAGELVRLLVQHPHFDIRAVVSASAAGEPIAKTFPHLAPALGDQKFSSQEEGKELLNSKRTIGLFSALPHGEAATMLADWIASAESAGCELKVVDLSSDFRYKDAAAYEAVYKKPHGAPHLLDRFECALPDIPGPSPDTNYLAHPGCFTTSVVLAITPLLAHGFVDPNIVVSAITGSTGAGRQPREGTHHPERHGGLWAYEPLRHRHQPEMENLAAISGTRPNLAFVPHSGPFSRGIHASIVCDLKNDSNEAAIIAAVKEYYRGTPFVQVRSSWPSVKDVAGTNMAHLCLRKEGNKLFVASVIDNLTKGAAGGGVQWMNALFAFDRAEGLRIPGLGWA